MRTVELGRAAAQAELLRFKLLIKRQVWRGVWAVVAAAFAIAVLVMIHVLLFQALNLVIAPIWSTVAVLVFDVVMLLIFGLVASSSKAGATEASAREVRDQALIEMRESLAISALLSPVGRVAVKAAGRGAVGALTPGFMQRKRRRK